MGESPILRFLRPPKLVDENTMPKARILHVTLVSAMIGAIPMGILNAQSGAFSFAVLLFGIALFSFLAISLNHRGHYRPSAIFLMILIYNAIVYTIIDGAGLGDPGIAAMPIFIFLTSLFFDKKGVVVSTFCTLGFLMLLYVLVTSNVISLNGPVTSNRLIILSILITASGAVAWTIVDLRAKTISEIQDYEAEKLDSVERYKVFVEASPTPIWTFEVQPPMPLHLPVEEQIDWMLHNTIAVEVNEANARIHGVRVDELIGLNLLEQWGGEEEYGSELLQVFVRQNYRLESYETLEPSLQGKKSWVLIDAVGVFKDNHLIRIWGTSHDINARKLAELATQESEEKFHKVFMASPYSMAITRLEDGVYVDVNEGFIKNTGYSREEIIGRTAIDFGLVTDEKSLRSYQIIAEQDDTRNIEMTLNHKDGQEIISLISSTSVELSGEPHRVSVGLNITDLKKSEAALIDSEVRYRTLFESASDTVLLLEDNRFIDCNNAVTTLFGYTKDEILGKHPGEVSPTFQPDGRPSISKAEDLIREVQSGLPQLFEWVHQKKDGSQFTAEVILHQTDVQGKPLTLAVVRDVSERKVAEEAAREERQRLARDLHDAVSQTLWSASLIADVLPNIWREDPKKGLERLDRLGALTRGALAEMRALLLELRPRALVETRLSELLSRLVEATASRTGADISLEIEKDCELPEEVHIVIYRLAQEALNNTTRHADANQIEVRVECDSRYVKLMIADNGSGFDPNDIQSGQHLGLQIMRERTESIGADLEITSDPGKGTQLRFSWQGDLEMDHV
jgi:PAS domain S-box-containing protein